MVVRPDSSGHDFQHFSLCSRLHQTLTSVRLGRVLGWLVSRSRLPAHMAGAAQRQELLGLGVHWGERDVDAVGRGEGAGWAGLAAPVMGPYLLMFKGDAFLSWRD